MENPIVTDRSNLFSEKTTLPGNCIYFSSSHLKINLKDAWMDLSALWQISYPETFISCLQFLDHLPTKHWGRLSDSFFLTHPKTVMAALTGKPPQLSCSYWRGLCIWGVDESYCGLPPAAQCSVEGHERFASQTSLASSVETATKKILPQVPTKSTFDVEEK